MDNKATILMQRYEIGRLLGQGTFAKVYYARNIKNGHSVAIKVIDKDKVLRVGLMDQIKREISVLRLVKHPHIVQLYEVMATKLKVYFVMEYVKGGELFDKIARGRLREDTARKYFQQLISAVDYCHSRGVYHRDLKPENMLLDDAGNLKVSDFGLSALVDSQRLDGLLHTTCGTPAYVAPEVISRKGYDGAKADIWSCGVILYVLLAGYLPFQDSNLMELYRKIGKADYKCPSWFPSDIRKLLLQILDPSPYTRISISKIVENPWFQIGLEDKLWKNKADRKEAVVAYSNEDSSPQEQNNTEAKQEPMIPTNLNAFDIISLSSGFDLSGLFETAEHNHEARFTSKEHSRNIVSKLEDVAKNLNFKVKKDGGKMKIEESKDGRKGPLAIDVEIFEISPSFHIVEMRKANGDTMEYEKAWNKDIKPALKDIVWGWQGEKHEQQVQAQLPS